MAALRGPAAVYPQVAVRDEGQERVEVPIVEHADAAIELALQLRTDGDRWRVGW